MSAAKVQGSVTGLGIYTAGVWGVGVQGYRTEDVSCRGTGEQNAEIRGWGCGLQGYRVSTCALQGYRTGRGML